MEEFGGGGGVFWWRGRLATEEEGLDVGVGVGVDAGCDGGVDIASAKLQPTWRILVNEEEKGRGGNGERIVRVENFLGLSGDICTILYCMRKKDGGTKKKIGLRFHGKVLFIFFT